MDVSHFRIRLFIYVQVGHVWWGTAVLRITPLFKLQALTSQKRKRESQEFDEMKLDFFFFLFIFFFEKNPKYTFRCLQWVVRFYCLCLFLVYRGASHTDPHIYTNALKHRQQEDKLSHQHHWEQLIIWSVKVSSSKALFIWGKWENSKLFKGDVAPSGGYSGGIMSAKKSLFKGPILLTLF